MTYKLATSIRSMVYHLNQSWGCDNFKCAIENPSEVSNRWEVNLFNANARGGYDAEMWALAIAIQKAGCGLCIMPSTYDAGPKRGHFVECIKIF